MMVESARRVVVNATNVEHDVGGYDLLLVAGPDQPVIVSDRLETKREPEGRVGERIVTMEFPAVGQQSGYRRHRISFVQPGLKIGKAMDL